MQVDDDEPLFDNLSQKDGDHAPLIYDLESYQIPAVFRRVLMFTKLGEVIEIKTTKENKLIDNLPDE